jgi:hypothetical protein
VVIVVLAYEVQGVLCPCPPALSLGNTTLLFMEHCATGIRSPPIKGETP